MKAISTRIMLGKPINLENAGRNDIIFDNGNFKLRASTQLNYFNPYFEEWYSRQFSDRFFPFEHVCPYIASYFRIPNTFIATDDSSRITRDLTQDLNSISHIWRGQTLHITDSS